MNKLKFGSTLKLPGKGEYFSGGKRLDTVKSKTLGIMTDDPIGALLGMNGSKAYMQFHSRHGINGLARVSRHGVDILAVMASKPGTGQFTPFLKDLMREYSTVTFWLVSSPLLRVILTNNGFAPVTELQHGSIVPGMRWKMEGRA